MQNEICILTNFKQTIFVEHPNINQNFKFPFDFGCNFQIKKSIMNTQD